MKCTRIWLRNSFRGDKKKKAIVLLARDTLTYKLSQIVRELWPAQDLGFRKDKYIKKKVRIVSLAYDTSFGPYLCLYQILSKYFKPL